MTLNIMNSEPLIICENLVKIYRLHQDGGGSVEVQALQGMDITVAEGEMLGIVGASGSGKSTLLNVLGGLDRPTEGRVRIDGADLTTLDDARLTELRRRRIGFVFQFFNLIPVLDAIENAALPLTLDGVKPAEARAKASEWLTKVGLGNRLRNRPDQLSGGQQQRVAIARALVADPALVLADEPTGNLDAKTGNEIMALLDEMTRQVGKTLIMVTHSRQIAARADRVLTIQNGQLVSMPEE